MGNSVTEMKEPEHADNGRDRARQTTGMEEATVISQFHRVPAHLFPLLTLFSFCSVLSIFCFLL